MYVFYKSYMYNEAIHLCFIFFYIRCRPRNVSPVIYRSHLMRFRAIKPNYSYNSYIKLTVFRFPVSPGSELFATFLNKHRTPENESVRSLFGCQFDKIQYGKHNISIQLFEPTSTCVLNPV